MTGVNKDVINVHFKSNVSRSDGNLVSIRSKYFWFLSKNILEAFSKYYVMHLSILKVKKVTNTIISHRGW